MTALPTAPITGRAAVTAAAASTPDDRRRRVSGILLIAAAISVIAGFLTNPVAESPTDRLHAATQHATATEVSILIGTLGILLLIPGLSGLGRALRLRSPRLGSAGVAITLAGFVCLLANFGVNAVYLELAKANVPAAQSVALIDRMETNSLAFGVIFAGFLLGHLIGPILIGIALWRSHYVPIWAAALLPVGSIGHFLANAISSHPLDIVAFLALGLGLSAAGRSMITTPITEDHPVVDRRVKTGQRNVRRADEADMPDRSAS